MLLFPRGKQHTPPQRQPGLVVQHTRCFLYWCLARHHGDLGSIRGGRDDTRSGEYASRFLFGNTHNNLEGCSFAKRHCRGDFNPGGDISSFSACSRQIFWAENAGETGGEGFFLSLPPPSFKLVKTNSCKIAAGCQGNKEQ